MLLHSVAMRCVTEMKTRGGGLRHVCVEMEEAGCKTDACVLGEQQQELHAWHMHVFTAAELDPPARCVGLTMRFLGCSSRRITSSTVVLRMLLLTMPDSFSTVSGV
jgi:hypothetical protein